MCLCDVISGRLAVLRVVGDGGIMSVVTSYRSSRVLLRATYCGGDVSVTSHREMCEDVTNRFRVPCQCVQLCVWLVHLAFTGVYK